MKNSNIILKNLDDLFPDARCELVYHKDYELLLATILSAQTTDKRVNEVTKELFEKYDIFSLAKTNPKKIEEILRPVGMGQKKSQYLVAVAKALVKDYNGVVPNNRDFLENLPGVGHKTCNVVLSNLFNEPALAVDTHVKRVASRLELTKSDNVAIIEKDLMKFFPKDKWGRVHHQLVLFGRYICKSKNPDCNNCPFNCKFKK